MTRHHLTFAAAAVAAVSLLSLAGCGGVGRRAELPPATPVGANQLIANNFKQVDRFEGDFTLSLQAVLFRGSFFGQCWIDHPDRLAASIRAPLGIRVGDLVLKDGRYELSMGNGRIETGRVDSLDIQALTGVPFPTDDLQVLFDPVAKPPRRTARTINFQVLGNDSLWVWRLDEGSMERQIHIDPAEAAVVLDEWVDKSGRLILRKQYSSFEMQDGTPVARHLKLVARGTLPVAVDLTFNRSEVNPSWRESPFQFKWVSEP